MQNELRTLSAPDELKLSEQGLFFVIGCGRSGTTLLQVMLDSHSDIVMPNETHFYSTFSRDIRNKTVTAQNLDSSVDEMLNFEHIRPMKLDRAQVLEFARHGAPSWDTIFLAILTTFRLQRGGKRVGEKTPAHYLALWDLYEAFPDAKFINLIRDPRGVVDSFMKAPFYKNFGKNPMHAIHSWRMAINRHKEAASKADPKRYISVRYEDLVEQPEFELKRLTSFLGVEFEPTMMDFHNRDYSGFLAGESHKMGTFKPVYKDSTEKWRKSLSNKQVSLIEGILEGKMKELGYKLDTTPQPLMTKLNEKMLFAAYKGRMRARKLLQLAGIGKRGDLGGIAETSSDDNG